MSDPSGREFDMLRHQVTTQQARLNDIDDHGTRGIGTVQAQLTELVKDVIELKLDLNTRFATHEKVHETETAARVTSRRWLIGTGLATLATLATIIALLIDIASRVHR